ncbi:MAG: hypothetical protein IH600_07485 [Bacteroidetes bacterium]|nr:hypothetical protein [Bacteroidota bacterium]
MSRRAFIAAFILITFSTSLHAQNVADDVQVVEVNKRVRDFPDRYDLSSPLRSFVTFKHLMAKGSQSLLRSVNTYRNRAYFPEDDAPDVQVEPEKRTSILGTHIREVVLYRDSVAAVLTDYQDGPLVIITYMIHEDGKWLSAGEDLGNDLEDARKRFREKAPWFASRIDRIRELRAAPSDSAAFVSYLETHGQPPESYLLDALGRHRLVIYGEVHRRKASWDLMKRVVVAPAFALRVGTIFMELSSDKQDALDRFYAGANADRELLLDVFRDVQINGWWDRGMFEFLIEVWKLNETLPASRKIKVVAVDIPRPFRSFSSEEEMKQFFERAPDRNEEMADIIYDTMVRQDGNRNYLFIVGIAHATTAPVPGIASGRPRSESLPPAAAQLAERLPGQVFSIFQHGPIISNDGTVHGYVRHGLFDRAFKRAGYTSVAFDLADSPFGREPFDGIYEISYDNDVGQYLDNYDGYIYLGSLATEESEYILYDLFSDEYVEELTRRAALAGTTVEAWFGVEVADREAIVSHFKQRTKGKLRWPRL